jgi:hypothetical protein
MTIQDPSNETGAGLRKPPKRTDWLKVTLATGGIALTMLGTGLIAQREAGQANAADAVQDGGSSGTIDLQPIPTAISPGLLQGMAPADLAPQSDQQLQAPSLGSSQQQFRMRSFAQSRSSR